MTCATHLVTQRCIVNQRFKRPAQAGCVARTQGQPSRTWLDRLGQWFASQRQNDIEAYLAKSQDVFELEAPLRKQRYANAGLVAFSTEHWPDFLERWERACTHIDPSRIFDGNWHQPFWAGDQDALNALLMSEVPADAIAEGDQAETLLFDSVNDGTIEDEKTLRLSLNGVPIRFIHYGLSPKAWQRQGWRRIREDDTYARLLPRVLFADDVAVRLRGTRVPLWIRPGPIGRLALVTIGGANTVGSMVKRRDVVPIKRRLGVLLRRLRG